MYCSPAMLRGTEFNVQRNELEGSEVNLLKQRCCSTRGTARNCLVVQVDEEFAPFNMACLT
jgi:hypothetical protein